jgi:hypothetical protein
MYTQRFLPVNDRLYFFVQIVLFCVCLKEIKLAVNHCNKETIIEKS